MGKDKPAKLTKEQKKQRELYRTHVITAVEQLRRAPLSGSEKRFLTKKDFLPNELRQSVVEVLCDHVQANAVGISGLFEFFDEENAVSRAIWYSLATYNPELRKEKKAPKEGKPPKFDPCGEDRSVFDIDVRVVSNVHVVAEALWLYWRDSRGDIFSQDAYESFLKAFGAAGDDVAQRNASLSNLLRSLTAENLASLQRTVMMVNALPDEATQSRAAKVLSDAILRRGMASDEQRGLTMELRHQAFVQLCKAEKELFPAEYRATPDRESQSRHFVPERLAENEFAILLAGAERVKFKSGEVAVEENTHQTAIYRVAEGSFSVTVGSTHVASLVPLDWFGEVAFLGGGHVSRARVTAEKRGGVLLKVPFGKLDAILLSRPDLAAKFYSLLAIETATRLNVALIKSSRAGEKDLAVDPNSHDVSHVLRMSTAPRNKENGESSFLYEANTHAVRIWSCERIPKKANKKPREGLAFVFPTQFVNLYHKGHSERKSVVPFQDVTQFSLEEKGSRITIGYKSGKKEKSIVLQFKDNATASTVYAVTVQIRNAEPTGAPVRDFGPVSARAAFAYPTTRPNELPLSVGDRLTVLDEAGDFYYGFKTDEPDKKGLFGRAFVELRPLGVGVSGTLQHADWKTIEQHFVRQSLKKGDTVLKLGDQVNAGNIMFVESGELVAQRLLASGLPENLGYIAAGETFGELMFLLGGVPRANVVVHSDTAEVLTLPRSKLVTEVLKDSVFAAKFWKFLCCTISSRLMAIQSRLNDPLPLPPAIQFEVPKEEAAKAMTLGSQPSLPELPPPPLNPQDELIMKIKQRGAFFLGVDVPSDVEHRVGSPRKQEKEEEKE